MNKTAPLFTALLLFALAARGDEQTTVVTEKTETPVTVTETVEKTKVFTGTLSSVNIPLSTMSLSTEGSSSPVTYSYTEQTKFYDGENHPLTPAALEPGAAVTLTYVQIGEKLIVVKAVIAKSVVTTQTIETMPVVEQKTTVITPVTKKTVRTKKKVTPEVIETKDSKTTTTTTER